MLTTEPPQPKSGCKNTLGTVYSYSNVATWRVAWGYPAERDRLESTEEPEPEFVLWDLQGR